MVIGSGVWLILDGREALVGPDILGLGLSSAFDLEIKHLGLSLYLRDLSIGKSNMVRSVSCLHPFH